MMDWTGLPAAGFVGRSLGAKQGERAANLELPVGRRHLIALADSKSVCLPIRMLSARPTGRLQESL